MSFEPVKKYTGPEEFVEETVERIRYAVADETVLGFLSGGIDSTTCGKLAVKALGERGFRGRHFDHGGMRKDEWKDVIYYLNNGCGIPTSFHDYSETFLKAVMEAGADAEKKREVVSKTYFDLALKEAKMFDAKFFIHGTIEPDWLETSTLKLKRQHNVLLEEQKKRFKEEGIEVIEPLYYLRKPQVREVARYLGLPSEVTERKPFPGPGLYCRAIGQVTVEKMEVLREVDALVRPKLEEVTASMLRYSSQEDMDYQCLCALVDNKTNKIEIEVHPDVDIEDPRVTEDKVTGMIEGKRSYTKLLLFDSWDETKDLIDYSEEIIKDNINKGIGRCATLLWRGDPRGKYLVILRSILTKDFTTAQVTPIPRDILRDDIASEIRMREIAGVYYDITPKPPATIEFE